MTIARIPRQPAGSHLRSLFDTSDVGAGFLLTAEDRVGIERLLRHRGTKHAPNPALLNGLLQHKLLISPSAPNPVPRELVVADCHVAYRISGEAARSGVLTMSPVPVPGRILVASLLGATMIGMRKYQTVPLLRDNGQIGTLHVLDVIPPQNHDTAR